MYKINLTKIWVFFLFSAFLISGCEKNPNELVEKLLENRVVLAHGFNFNEKRFILFNAETGKEVPACKPFLDSKLQNQNIEGKTSDSESKIPKCKSEFILDDNPALSTALELSKKTIKGKIMKKDGKVVDATYFVVVTALFPGSHCNSSSGPGTSGEDCGRE